MTWTQLIALLVALAQPPLSAHEGGPALERAIEHVESTGSGAAVSERGAVGLWQVMPAVAAVPPVLLRLPQVSRGEGRRIWRRWAKRCRRAAKGRAAALPPTAALQAGKGGLDDPVVRCTARSYACGSKGLKLGWCEWHVDKLRKALRGTDVR